MAFRIGLRGRGGEQEVMKWAGGINKALEVALGNRVIKVRFKGGWNSWKFFC